MSVMYYSLLIEVAWPLAAIVAAVLLFLFGSRWLRRSSLEFTALSVRLLDLLRVVDELKAEIAKRDGEWVEEFKQSDRDNDRRIAHCERNIAATAPDFKPLGKHYNPRA